MAATPAQTTTRAGLSCRGQFLGYVLVLSIGASVYPRVTVRFSTQCPPAPWKASSADLKVSPAVTKSLFPCDAVLSLMPSIAFCIVRNADCSACSACVSMESARAKRAGTFALVVCERKVESSSPSATSISARGFSFCAIVFMRVSITQCWRRRYGRRGWRQWSREYDRCRRRNNHNCLNYGRRRAPDQSETQEKGRSESFHAFDFVCEQKATQSLRIQKLIS